MSDPLEQKREVVADGGQKRIDGIALNSSDQNRRNCRGDPSRRSGTASIIRINPRLVAGLDIEPHIQRTRMPDIPYSASAAPDGVSLPLTTVQSALELHAACGEYDTSHKKNGTQLIDQGRSLRNQP